MMNGQFSRLFLAAGLLAWLPLACSSSVSTAGRSNSSNESPAPQQDDAQIDRQASGTIPNVLAGVNLVTYANVVPDCVDNFTGKQLTGFSCYSAAKNKNVVTRSKNLEANLVLSWELPSSLNGVTSCPAAVDRVTEIHCTYSSSSAPPPPFKAILKATKGGQSRNIPSENIAQPSSSGGGNGDISSAASLVIYLAGKISGDAGVDAFNSKCQAAINSNATNASSLNITHGRVLLKGWESQFPQANNLPIYTPGVITVGQTYEMIRQNLADGLHSFTNAGTNLIATPSLGLEGIISHDGDVVWTGMGDPPNWGFNCDNWSTSGSQATTAIIGSVDSRQLYFSNDTCNKTHYIYCLGW